MIWAVSVSPARYVVREDVSAYLLGSSELLEFCDGWRGGEGGNERQLLSRRIYRITEMNI